MDYIHYATYHPYYDMGHRYLPHPVATNKAFPHGVSLGTTGLPARTVASKILDLERANFPSKYERRADLDRMRSKRRVEDFSSIPRKSYSDYLRPTNVDRVYISPWSSVFPSYEDYDTERPIRRYPVRPVRQVGLGLPGSWRCLALRREDQDLDPLTIEIEAEQVKLTADKEARRLQSAMWQSVATDRVIRMCQERNRYREQEKRLENARLVAPIYHCPDSHLGIRQKVLINYHKGGGTEAGGDVTDSSAGRPSPSPAPVDDDDVSTRVTLPLKRQKTLEDPVVNAAEEAESESVNDDVVVAAEQERPPPAVSPKQVPVVEAADDNVEEPPASPKKPTKGKVPPKLSILKANKKSESFEEQPQPKTPTKVKTPKTPVSPQPKTPASPQPIAPASPEPKTPTEPEVSALTAPRTPTPSALVPQSPTPKTPTKVPESPTYVEARPPAPKSPIPSPEIELNSEEDDAQEDEAQHATTIPLDVKIPDDVVPESEIVQEPEEQEEPSVEVERSEDLEVDQDQQVNSPEEENKIGEEQQQQDDQEDVDGTSSPPPSLRRLVSNVSSIKEGESCDPEEWVDDDPPSVEVESDETRARVILSASDVPSVLAKRMADEEEDEEHDYDRTPVIQTEEPSNAADVEVDEDRRGSHGRNLGGSVDRLTSENVELLSMSTNENAEAGSAITGDATEGTLSANGRPLSVDAESLIADEEQQPGDEEGADEQNDNDRKMTVDDPDEVTLKSEDGYERTKSLSIEEQSDEE